MRKIYLALFVVFAINANAVSWSQIMSWKDKTIKASV